MKKTDFSRKYAVNSAQRQIPPLMRDQNYMRGIGLALGFQGNGFMTKALARASVTGVLEARRCPSCVLFPLAEKRGHNQEVEGKNFQ
jgi:hypothetical protein